MRENACLPVRHAAFSEWAFPIDPHIQAPNTKSGRHNEVIMTHGQRWTEELRSAAAQVEAEWKRGIADMNDRVVPWARREGILAMTSLAAHMRRLADKIDGRYSRSWEPR